MASLFRNFLLAERIMRAASCSPASFPRLPPMHQHPMWQVRTVPLPSPAEGAVCRQPTFRTPSMSITQHL